MFAETAFRLPHGKPTAYPDRGHGIVVAFEFARDVTAFLRADCVVWLDGKADSGQSRPLETQTLLGHPRGTGISKQPTLEPVEVRAPGPKTTGLGSGLAVTSSVTESIMAATSSCRMFSSGE